MATTQTKIAPLAGKGEVKTTHANGNSTPAQLQQQLALTQQLAVEINEQHALAATHADLAVNYAKRAGVLLLQVKQSLPHGDFLPWIAANISVSERQAQRYINVARRRADARMAPFSSGAASGLDIIASRSK